MSYDNIINALECLSGRGKEWDCKTCGFNVKTCASAVSDAVVNLLKEQQDTIRELEVQVDNQYEQAKADILGNMADGGASCHWCIDGHRSAAIREFAERLKTYFITPAQTKMDTEIVELIETLVKEMTKGTDNV